MYLSVASTLDLYVHLPLSKVRTFRQIQLSNLSIRQLYTSQSPLECMRRLVSNVLAEARIWLPIS